MAWIIKLDAHALKQLEKLDRSSQKRIVRFLQDRLVKYSNPRLIGKPLIGKMFGLWRYRVGDYRIICQINDAEMLVLVINVNHRKEIYRH